MQTKVRIILAALACSALGACSGEDVTANTNGSAQQSAVADTSAPATPASSATGTSPGTTSTVTPATTPAATASTTPSANVVKTTPVTTVTTPVKTATTPVKAPTTTTTTPVTSPVSTVVTTVTNTISSVLKPIVAAASTNVFASLRVRPMNGEEAPTPQDIGAFRIPCSYSHMAFDDPIVFPGQPGASHLHMFFGNASTDGNSTTDTLKAANRSTCAGGIANLTAYWVPAMIDTSTNRALVPFDNMVYYKSGYNAIPLSSLKNPPRGLRMITGNKATESTSVADARYNFECFADSLPNGRSGQSKGIPACPVGGEIVILLDYPNCWDGVNLDSPDHRSHVAFSGGGACPSSHPVALPQVSLNIHYRVEVGQNASKWKLASDNYTTGPGGYSMHGDLWFNWQDDIAETFMTNCVRARKDCHGYLLGDGRTLY